MSVEQFTADLMTLLPFSFIVLWGCVLLIAELFVSKENTGTIPALAGLGMLAGIALSLLQVGQNTSAFGGLVAVDGFAVFLNVLVLASGLIGIAMAYDYLQRMNLYRPEFYTLLTFSVSGMMLMGTANDLMTVFLALELLSIPLYVMSGIARPKVQSEEAAIKYFLLGSFASGFVVFGVALIFGATATTSLPGIVAAVTTGALLDPTLFLVGAGLMIIGLGFKVAAVPFHMWTPDVYEGAPTAVTSFMAAGAKAGGFAALLRVFVIAFPSIGADLTPVFYTVAAATMIVGNLLAISQSNIKRMLAYSSIAHAGYILMALVSYATPGVSADAVAATLFYLVAYTLTNFGAWSVVMSLEQAEGKGLRLEDYAGLASKAPWMAAAMTVFMLSFTGMPPTLGFVGKFFLFRTVIDGGFTSLAIIGVVTSLISAYYYLRVVVMMYMREGKPEVRSDLWLNLTTGLTAAGLLALTIFSAPLFDWAARAILGGS